MEGLTQLIENGADMSAETKEVSLAQQNGQPDDNKKSVPTSLCNGLGCDDPTTDSNGASEKPTGDVTRVPQDGVSMEQDSISPDGSSSRSVQSSDISSPSQAKRDISSGCSSSARDGGHQYDMDQGSDMRSEGSSGDWPSPSSKLYNYIKK